MIQLFVFKSHKYQLVLDVVISVNSLTNIKNKHGFLSFSLKAKIKFYLQKIQGLNIFDDIIQNFEFSIISKTDNPVLIS